MQNICSGTLLNSYAVISAGHCILTEFTQNIDGINYRIPIENPFDNNKFSLYVGAHDISTIKSGGNPQLPATKVLVSQIIRVC